MRWWSRLKTKVFTSRTPQSTRKDVHEDKLSVLEIQNTDLASEKRNEDAVNSRVRPEATNIDSDAAIDTELGEQKRRNMLMSFIYPALSRHVYNTVPAHLIHIETRTLMDRPAILEMARPEVLRIAEEAYLSGDGKAWKTTESIKWRVEEAIAQVLQYAIFSHRWLSRGEPTFGDISKRIPSDASFDDTSAGLQKLWKFCEKAGEHACRWAWSDTCCIDKTSSSELDEAIRSMYRWYDKANVCIVYLADTVESSAIGEDEWFTRGWTLQELLASHLHITWYGRSWEQLESPPPETLSQITTIPTVMFHPFSPYRPGVDMVREKMAWAARRRTTRVEDVAYSLLGIFRVTLVTAYGEGESAFYRLQRAIMERTNNIALLMWIGDPSEENSMIAGSPQCFADAILAHSLQLESEPPSRSWVQIRPGQRALLDIDRLLPRGSRTFALTNAGLRVDLVLYDISVPGGLKQVPPTFTKWPPGEFTPDGICWTWEEAGKTPFTKSVYFVRGAQTSGQRYALGIVDYEWDDAKCAVEGKSYQDIFWRETVEAEWMDEGEQLLGLDEAIVLRRKTRPYFAVILELVEDTTEAYSFRRDWVLAHRHVTVRRPQDGWKTPQTVYIK